MDQVLSLLDATWKSYDLEMANAIAQCVKRIHSDEFIQAFKYDITRKWAFNYEGELVLPKIEKLLIQIPDSAIVITEYYVQAVVDEVNKIFVEKNSSYIIKYRYVNHYEIYCTKV